MKEKRSLFKNIFGEKAEKQQQVLDGKTYLQLLNSFTPVFNEVGYDSSSLVKTCINTIATHCAKLVPKHRQRAGGTIRDIDGDINYLLSVQPNPLMTRYDFIYKIVSLTYKYNNAFVFIDKDDDGFIKGFYPIEANSYTLLEDKSGQVYLKFNFRTGKTYYMYYEDVIHIRRFFSSHEIFGDDNSSLKAPVKVAGTAMQGLDNAIKTSMYLRGLLKFTNNMIKRPDMEKYKKEFVEDFSNLDNESGIAVLDARADYQELGLKPVTLDKDQLNYTKENIYDYFGVNQKIISSSYSDEEWNSFYESVIEPVAIQLGLAFTVKIFSRESIKSKGNFIEFNTNRVKYAKLSTKISFIKEVGILGLMMVDEAREVIDLPPLGGEEGRKRYQTLNVVDADMAKEYQGGGE